MHRKGLCLHLGHLTHEQLIAFLRRAKSSLRPRNDATDGSGKYGPSVIMIKENCCDDIDGPHEFLDEEDSSLTR